MSDKQIAVKVQNLTKSFRIPLESSTGIKQKLINTLKGRKGYRDFTPLNDVSFEIEKGDFFGIVGRNGSGKSTLLKTIAGIYAPNDGLVQVNGTLVPFIELGVGFNPELSGRENVFLNGALLGFSHDEMRNMYDDIVDFAELHDFMDENLKNYSSGMQVRLAFSIAIRARGDILLLDEVLAVGDEAFQRKCYNYFAQLRKEKKTVILVTHSMDAVQQFCSKAALIDKHHELVVGTPLEVAKIYRELNAEDDTKPTQKKQSNTSSNKYFSCNVTIKKSNDRLDFTTILKPLQKITADDCEFTFLITKTSGEILYRFTSEKDIREHIDFNQTNVITISLDNVFPDDSYAIHAGVKAKDRSKNYALFDDIATFTLSNGIGKEYWRPPTSYKLTESNTSK